MVRKSYEKRSIACITFLMGHIKDTELLYMKKIGKYLKDRHNSSSCSSGRDDIFAATVKVVVVVAAA